MHPTCYNIQKESKVASPKRTNLSQAQGLTELHIVEWLWSKPGHACSEGILIKNNTCEGRSLRFDCYRNPTRGNACIRQYINDHFPCGALEWITRKIITNQIAYYKAIWGHRPGCSSQIRSVSWNKLQFQPQNWSKTLKPDSVRLQFLFPLNGLITSDQFSVHNKRACIMFKQS